MVRCCSIYDNLDNSTVFDPLPEEEDEDDEMVTLHIDEDALDNDIQGTEFRLYF